MISKIDWAGGALPGIPKTEPITIIYKGNSMESKRYFALLLIFVSSAALSGDWYVGAGIGKTDAGFPQPDPPASSGTIFFTSYSHESDTSGTAGKIFAGYQFNEYFAVQSGYTDMDELTTYRERYSLEVGAVESSGTASIDGFTVSALGRWPFSSNLAVKGGAGIYEWDEQRDVRYHGTGIYSDMEFSSRGDGEGTDWFYTITLEAWWFSLEYQTYTLTHGETEIDVDYTGLSWQYRF